MANWDLLVGAATPVGLFPAGNTLEGLVDMSGSVREWCLDHYDKGYYTRGEAAPSTEGEDETRVLRGGAFGYHQDFARYSFRDRAQPDGRGGDGGFRVSRPPRS